MQLSQWGVCMGATNRGAEQHREAMRAAVAMSYGQDMPLPPANVSLPRWRAMVKFMQRYFK